MFKEQWHFLDIMSAWKLKEFIKHNLNAQNIHGHHITSVSKIYNPQILFQNLFRLR